MKTKILSLLAVSALLFSACSSNEEVVDNDLVAVRFTSSIATPSNAPTLRAANDAWEAGDAIGIYMVGNATATINNGATNKQHVTTTGSSSFTAVKGEAIFYPVEATKKVDFIAYYPYTANQTLGDYSLNVTTQTSQHAIDLLWTKADNLGGDLVKQMPLCH